MAELSLETQAILGRLKAEGDLLRNSGTNSIKSVKVELAKFSGLFETLQTSINSQVETLQEAAGFSQDAAEAQRRQNELLEMAGVTEQERAELEKRRFQTDKLKADQDFKDQEDREKARQKSEKGFFKKMGGFFSKETFGKILTGFKIAALAGVGLTLGYQFLAGFLEGMGVDVESLEQGFKEGFNEFVKFLKDVDWAKWGAVLSDPLTLAGIAGLSAIPSLLGIVGDIALTKAALKSLRTPTTVPGDVTPDKDSKDKTKRSKPPKTDTPDVDTKPPKGKSPLNLRSLLNWRTAVISAIGAGLIGYSEEIGNFFKKDAENISKEELLQQDVKGTVGNEALSTIGGAVTLGSLFGIKGMIAGAIIGGAYVIGKSVYETIDDQMNDLDQLPNDIQAALMYESQRERGVSGHAGRIANAAKTVEEKAAEWKEGVTTEMEGLAAQAEEIKTKLENNEYKGHRKTNAEVKLVRLNNELELRRQQLENVDALLLERAEKGVADFDIYEKGTQTKAQFEVNQKKRQEAIDALNAKLNESLYSTPEGIEIPESPLVLRSAGLDMDQQPKNIIIDKSTRVNNTPTTVVNKTQKVEQMVGIDATTSGNGSGSVYPGG